MNYSRCSRIAATTSSTVNDTQLQSITGKNPSTATEDSAAIDVIVSVASGCEA